ncbi:hypothetical protein EDC02_4582 [Micromonospora sp. Llam0]|nr:hypothetical protein EDC02_4582 [Micromonospora sp. Llam0]
MPRMTVFGRLAAGCAATSLAALSIATPAQAVESDEIAWVSPFIEVISTRSVTMFKVK